MADWKNGVARFLDRVDTKIDEQRRRLGATGGAGKRARIDPYRGFGTPERAHVRGRVLRGSPIPTADATDSALLNLAAMVQRFESDEVPRARVRVVFAGGERIVTTDDEGFFECEVEPSPGFAPGAIWHEMVLELLEPRDGDEPYRTLGHVLVPPATSAFGVISDLDDTVIRTGVTSKLRMARTVLFGNARTRVPFPGVGAFYRALQQGTGASAFNPIFYVSSSPWNLHDLLAEFLSLQKIPLGPLLLRDWGLSGEVLPTSNEEHKMAAIRRIMDYYPALPFILVGDTSQEDPEIYARVVRSHPERIRAVYIRNVDAQPDRVAAIRALAAELEKTGSALILADDTLAAAEHAASRGWIAPAAVAEIRAEVQSSTQPRASTAGGEVNEELSRKGGG